ncbi:MAG: hypothetical protein ABJZ55_09065 [Fuerstiella sp.]
MTNISAISGQGVAILLALVFGFGDSNAFAFQTNPPSENTEDRSSAAASASEGATKATAPTSAAPSSTNDAVASKKEEEAKELRFTEQPYTVLISVGFEGDLFKTSASREQMLIEIQQSVQRLYGKLWKVTIRSNEWMIPGNADHLQRLTVEGLLARFPEEEFQKVFLLTVAGTTSRQHVACREFDTRMHEMTPVRQMALRDARSISNTCGRLIRDSFRPVLMFVRRFLDEEQHTRVEMQAQGGQILTPDASAIQVLPGDVLRPFRREMERRNAKKLKLLRPFPLTYMRVMSVDTEISRGMANTIFLSHLSPDSFLGKGRRTQRLALRQRPTAEQSVVRLVLTNRPDKPLISHRLALAYQLGYKDKEAQDQTKLVSDRNGDVTISVSPDHPTFWIRVYSGSSLLARVPYAPGLIPFDTVKLPDDSVRLGVEGEIQLLSDELIDAIAKREVLIARAEKQADAGEVDLVTSLLEQYAEISGKDYFIEQVKAIQTLAEKEAKSKRVGSKRLAALCESFKGSVETFFTDEKRATRLQQIREIKGTAERKSNETL